MNLRIRMLLAGIGLLVTAGAISIYDPVWGLAAFGIGVFAVGAFT